MRFLGRLSTLFLLCMVTAALLSCSTPGGPRPHQGVASLWRSYADMPAARALAIAGDPDRVWVGGASGGHESQQEAEENAMAECRKRRSARRMQAPCRLYASGSTIVW
jgi:hypothetical protein